MADRINKTPIPRDPAHMMEFTLNGNDIIPKIKSVIPLTRLIIPVLKNHGYFPSIIKRTDMLKKARANTIGKIKGMAETKSPLYLKYWDIRTET